MKNPEHHGRMKHMDLRYQWLRSVVAEGWLSVQYLQTADMPADVLTKVLGKSKQTVALEMLGLRK